MLLASDRLHVPPWELTDVSEFWISAALEAAQAERAAQAAQSTKGA